ncbi:hypothetical protein [Companilactobacillus keshanensis]|uniref:ABC transporter permease n=1 Tax=Companilactobacillus keshanensis TaxID=2486003 RepID=A0ABW4BS18_9LACO|nr:hypothetical protein [Companilactobacillus keshanensis]
MINYLKFRIIKRSIIISLAIGSLLSAIQILQSLIPIIKYGNIFLESPYIKWLSIDPFNFVPIVFFMLIPLMASIPSANILKEDLDSGLLLHLKNKVNLNKIVLGYGLTAFSGGFLTIFITLITNFLSYFLFLPNIKPDFLINENLLIIQENTLFVGLFYQHPFVHGILSILLTSIWGGIFAVMTCALSLWIKEKFLALLSSTVFQIIILLLNMFFKLPNLASYVPADFLRETSPSATDIKIVIGITILISVISILLLTIGRNKKIVW